MTEPLIEQIAEAVKAVVAGVVAGTVVKGQAYFQTLTPIRPKRNDWSDAAMTDGMVLVWQMDDEPIESPAMMTQELFQDFALICMVLDSDSATASIDTRINRVKSDLRKAFAANASLGGLAIDVQAAGSAKFDDGSGFSGVTVTFTVIYRTAADDPYAQI